MQLAMYVCCRSIQTGAGWMPLLQLDIDIGIESHIPIEYSYITRNALASRTHIATYTYCSILTVVLMILTVQSMQKVIKRSH